MSHDERLATLTDRQRQVYEFVAGFARGKGYSPTVREIGSHFDIRSPQGVLCHLDALTKKGLIRRDKGRTRSITLTEPSVCPHCGKELGEGIR